MSDELDFVLMQDKSTASPRMTTNTKPSGDVREPDLDKLAAETWRKIVTELHLGNNYDCLTEHIRQALATARAPLQQRLAALEQQVRELTERLESAAKSRKELLSAIHTYQGLAERHGCTEGSQFGWLSKRLDEANEMQTQLTRSQTT